MAFQGQRSTGSSGPSSVDNPSSSRRSRSRSRSGRHAPRNISTPIQHDDASSTAQGQAPMRNHSVVSQLARTPIQDFASITILISRLPTNITTREIYSSWNGQYQLNITRIDIFENDFGKRNGKAKVIIEPPPSKWPPWDVCQIRRANGSIVRPIIDSLSPRRYDDFIKTPLNNPAPRQIEFVVQGLLLGMMAKEDTMLKMKEYPYKDVRLAVQFQRRLIDVTFNINLGRQWGVKHFKIPIKFTHIKTIVHANPDGDALSLIIQLPCPPELYKRMSDANDSHDDDLSFWQERDIWLRQVEISRDLHLSKNLPACLEKKHDTIDIGRWTNYHLQLEKSFSNLWDRVESLLKDYNIEIRRVKRLHLMEPSNTTAWALLDGHGSATSLASLHSLSNIHLPFEVRYQLEVCISNGLFNEYSIDAAFLEKLNTFGADRARMMLEGVADQNISYYEPINIFKEPKVLNYWPTATVPPHAAMVRRVVITPTTVYFKTPCVELTNRVLRKYSDHIDRFLRVQFTDELVFGRLWSEQGSRKNDELYTRVHRVLRNGIVIGDRHYRTLAWSSSQFREHGAFFFCETAHITCDSIRQWMGDLTHIRSVGKYAARMGQCFTTTRQVRGISVPSIRPIPDIERRSGDNIWNFTDGVGKISPFLAEMIKAEHNLDSTPSCFQVRMGGVKGVLVLWPDVPRNEVHIRPSQQKFKSEYNGLEIIKVSTYSQATLNKQIIPILSSLGVDDEVFMDMLEEELTEYEEALSDSHKAAKLLRERVDENQITLLMAEMVETFMDCKEPFLWTLLRLWKCWVLQRLRQKAAISVKKSAFLFGCVDETGVLKGHSKSLEGAGAIDVDSLPQIFLQIPIEGSDGSLTDHYRVITGRCIVGRNPSLHPGDIRVVQAVDAPQLRHLKNVVVFPQTGERDIPSMCSGGDLDGDDFFVLWDQRLLPREWDYPPMHHDAESSSPGKEGGADVGPLDMYNFYAQYIKNDSLGLIATAHVAWADKLGPKDPKCIELAKLHSKAVDYVKSGQPASMHKRLNAKAFPHFMERGPRSYKSGKPLGRIYDRVRVAEFSPAYDMAFDTRILSRFSLEKDELDKAREIKAKYDIAMRRLMGQHENPVSEFEIWSTFILSKPRVGSDYKLQEKVGRETCALRDRFRSLCAEAVTGIPQKPTFFSYAGINLDKLDRFVAAMYTVTNEEVQETLRKRAMPCLDDDGNRVDDDRNSIAEIPLISFPWLFHRELGRVACGVQPVMRKWADIGHGGLIIKSNTYESSAPEIKPGVEAEICDQKNIALGEQKESTAANGGGEFDENENEGEGDDGGGGEDYVRTSSGQVIHRGDVLNLFSNLHSNYNASKDAHLASGEVSQFSPAPRSSVSEKNSQTEDGEFDEIEFEEVEQSGMDEENPLDALAKKLGSI